MRTPRISRETTRIVSALTSSPASPGTPLRRSTRDVQIPSIKVEQDDSSDSNLSSPPSSPYAASSAALSTASSGKRKRTGTTNSSINGSSISLKVKQEAQRRSPRKAVKLETRNEDSKPAKKAKRQPAKRITGPDGPAKVEPPHNWEEVYNITTEMRKHVLAPVDTMGCEDLAEKDRSPRDQRLQTLIALMLSSQTKDPVTAAAIRKLQEGLPTGLNLEALLAVEPDRLNELIGQVGFHNNKTRYIKATALLLRDNFAGDIPDTIEGLISLPGVGPKMAYLTMSAAWGRDEGIGVDVHVHRITNLWGWHKTSTPEQTRAELEAWLPKEKWHEINHLLVGFGQTICKPVGRRCDECELSRRKLCPSAVAGSPVKRRVKRKVELDEEGDVVKEEVMKVEEDDVAVKVEYEVDGEERVQVQTLAGASEAG